MILDTAPPEGVIASSPPSDDGSDWLVFLQDLKREAYKSANDAAKSLQTVSVALAAGYSAILTALKIADSWPRDASLLTLFVPVIIFWLAMIAAVLAMIPHRRRLSPDSPSEIEAFYTNLMNTKLRLVGVSIILLFAGIASVVAEIAGIPALRR